MSVPEFVLRELALVKDGKCVVCGSGSDGAVELAVERFTATGICVAWPAEMEPGSGPSIAVRECRPVPPDPQETTRAVLANEGNAHGKPPAEADIDYYEILQISPKADAETVSRVYRIMAARFHPDNPETGDVEKFLLMKTAYQVLSEPGLRAEYDSARQKKYAEPDPIFGLKDFVVGIEAEVNRRLGVLAVLYHQRRTVPEQPGVTLLELERRMGFPREHLEFTTWYLKAKKLAAVDDTSAFTLTALGADYVETNAPTNALLSELLRRGSRAHAPDASRPELDRGHLVTQPEQPDGE